MRNLVGRMIMYQGFGAQLDILTRIQPTVSLRQSRVVPVSVPLRRRNMQDCKRHSAAAVFFLRKLKLTSPTSWARIVQMCLDSFSTSRA